MATPQLAARPEDWISLAEPRAVSPSPFAGRDLKRQTPPVMSRSWSWARRGMWECEVALPSLGFESCMASAFRTQRESLLDWRAEAEPWTLSPMACPAAPDPEA